MKIDEYSYETCQGCGLSKVVDVDNIPKIIDSVVGEFITLVTRMREAQENYFKARRKTDFSESPYWLTQSKMLERQVDDFIVKYNNDKAQPKLF